MSFNYFFLVICACAFLATGWINKTAIAPNVDVRRYEVRLEPDLAHQSLTGEVQIYFTVTSGTSEVVLDAGKLEIISLEGEAVTHYQQQGNRLLVSIGELAQSETVIQIRYKGQPTQGLVWSDDPLQVYSVYFTREWMVCHDTPADKASIQLELLIPESLSCVANGTLISNTSEEEEKCLYTWNQAVETPAYTYGFAIGQFNAAYAQHAGIKLNYYAHAQSPEELKTIFRYTPDMLSFFEEKSGIPYDQPSYSQVLIGNHYQEMAGFSVLRKSYGPLVLSDSTETNLISHELAHQWWGNRITCVSWNHFWLHEGMATFMSAAFNEHQFGTKIYEANIESYFQVYQKIKEKGADRSLIFENWTNPSRDDRNLVYFKGAYVLHVLRQELGEEAFWQGIKTFSQRHYGKWVSTPDLQLAMEESAGRDLQDFFQKWVY